MLKTNKEAVIEKPPKASLVKKEIIDLKKQLRVTEKRLDLSQGKYASNRVLKEWVTKMRQRPEAAEWEKEVLFQALELQARYAPEEADPEIVRFMVMKRESLLNQLAFWESAGG